MAAIGELQEDCIAGKRGIPLDDISVTFEQVASALEAKAETGTTITYNDFALQMGLPRVNNLFSKSALSLLFEQIDADDAEEQRPFRTAVVVLKATGRPGSGFYRSIERHRGVEIAPPEETEVWSAEMSELAVYYNPTRTKTTLQIELSHAQSARLTRLCERAQRTPVELVKGRMTRLLQSLENEFARIEEADRQFQNGEFLEHEEVVALFKKRFHKSH